MFRNPKVFWLSAIIAAVAVFFIGVNFSRTNIGQTDILILPKSEKAVRNISQIIENASKIPLSLSFYDKLVEKGDLEDEAAGLPDHKRKEFWNSKLKIEKEGNSGILKIKFFDENSLVASNASKQAASDILVLMSRYYDIKNDLDLRIIDGPITKEKAPFLNWSWILASLAIGLILGWGLDEIVWRVSKVEVKKNIWTNLPQGWERTQDFFQEKIREFTPEKKSRDKEESIEKPEAPASKPEEKKESVIFAATKKSAAPDNLPIGSDFVLQSLKQSAEPEKKEDKKEQEGKKVHEATPEEVKRRLNKLLKGDM